MAFDLAALKQELEHATPSPEPSWALAIAIVCDTFRLARSAPPPRAAWDVWRQKWPRAEGLLMALARMLVSTSLRRDTVSALEDARVSPESVVDGFLDGVSPLNREMVLSNPFRREEFLRHWIAACRGSVAGETERQSEARLAQLDYRQAMAEYKKAEAARKVEAARRAQLLREAREREEQAKGWRE